MNPTGTGAEQGLKALGIGWMDGWMDMVRWRERIERRSEEKEGGKRGGREGGKMALVCVSPGLNFPSCPALLSP